MKTLAYLLPAFPVLSETFIGTEMRAMNRQGHRVVPIAFKRHAGPAQALDRRLAAMTWYLEDLSWGDALNGMLGTRYGVLGSLRFALKQDGLPARSLVYAALKLAALLRTERCDHVHAHFAQATAATAIVAARLVGATVSFVGHGYDIYATPADLDLKLRSVDFAVAVCRDMERDFLDTAPGASVGLVYCGVEPDRFRPLRNPISAARRLLFIGRLCETKGVDDLLCALAMIPEDHRPDVDFVGSGPLREEFVQLAETLGLSPWVRFLGNRPSEWIAQHGPGYRALVGPFKAASNGDRDTGPVVVKEAMAMGLPVVTTAFMGCNDMVSEETGIKTAPGDPVALAHSLQSIMQMSDAQIRGMGVAARMRVTSLFCADRQASMLSSMIEAA